MKILRFVILLSIFVGYSFSKSNINYIDPKPGANYVNIYNNIVIGFDKQINLSKNDILNCISVNGSVSGLHNGTITVCVDNKKIIFNTITPFSYNETVEVEVKSELLKTFSASDSYKYSFNTSMKKDIKWTSEDYINYEKTPIQNLFVLNPVFNVTINNDPSEGFLFLTPSYNSTFLEIRNKNGILYWSQQKNYFCCDWKKQPNNHYTYYDGNVHKFFELDGNYNYVNEYFCGNGYITDSHELRLLINGNALLMAYDSQRVDMSEIVEGGDTNALVIGLIIQEIDLNRNVVFQWRSWDHFQITDAWHENLTAPIIDAVHGNAIEEDNDGNLMISSRHLDEITKIDRITGDIIWRLGGKNNQFVFTNDTVPFTYQHAIRRLSNGNITIYDNGNFHSSYYSRAVEYSLDEINKTATLLWQFRRIPDAFGSWGGYVQRLENGNTLIGWGGATPTVTEVDSNGIIKFEATYQGAFTYRAYKFSLPGIEVELKNESSRIPEMYSLEQNYPNPFNPVTNISYNISKGSFVELIVFDVIGREVIKLVSEYKQPGNYKAIFNGSQLSSGIYIYKLKAGDFTSTKKMILIK